ETGTDAMPNKNIGFSKAAHYVAGYENQLGANLFFKAEAYYQRLFHIPTPKSRFWEPGGLRHSIERNLLLKPKLYGTRTRPFPAGEMMYFSLTSPSPTE